MKSVSIANKVFFHKGTLVGIRFSKRHIHTDGLQTFQNIKYSFHEEWPVPFSVSRHKMKISPDTDDTVLYL